jgi:hypothetical protein
MWKTPTLIIFKVLTTIVTIIACFFLGIFPQGAAADIFYNISEDARHKFIEKPFASTKDKRKRGYLITHGTIKSTGRCVAIRTAVTEMRVGGNPL